MRPFVRGGGVAARIADHFYATYTEHGLVTLADLALFYGTTRATMRKALRISEPLFNGGGLALKVPERDHGWVIATTDDHTEFLRSSLYRFNAMAAEGKRYATSEAAVANPGGTLFINKFVLALDSLIEELVEATA